MMRRICCVFSFGVAILAAGAAQALPVTGAAVGGGRGCTDAACTQQRFLWSSSSPSNTASGTLTLGGGNLAFSITLTSSTFLANPGPNDNGVTQIVFSNVTYTGNATVNGGGTITGGSATISGTQTPSGAGAAGAFMATDSLLGGSCSTVGSTVICGIIFLGNNDFNVDVNGQTRWFTHTVNVTAVPEPATALLFGAGLLGLALAGSRRQRADRA